MYNIRFVFRDKIVYCWYCNLFVLIRLKCLVNYYSLIGLKVNEVIIVNWVVI